VTWPRQERRAIAATAAAVVPARHAEVATGAVQTPFVQVWQASQSSSLPQALPTHSLVASAHDSPALQLASATQ